MNTNRTSVISPRYLLQSTATFTINKLRNIKCAFNKHNPTHGHEDCRNTELFEAIKHLNNTYTQLRTSKLNPTS